MFNNLICSIVYSSKVFFFEVSVFFCFFGVFLTAEHPTFTLLLAKRWVGADLSNRQEILWRSVFLTSTFQSGFGPHPGFEPMTFPSGKAHPTDVSIFTARPKLQVRSHDLWSLMKVCMYAEENLLLPHVSVTTFISDSTSNPAHPWAVLQKLSTLAKKMKFC